MGCRKTSTKREVIAIKSFLKKQENQFNFISKTTEKRRTEKPQKE